MIWFIHISVILFLFFLSSFFRKRKIFIYGSFIFVMFVYGQRWLSGTDFPGYLRYYVTSFTRWNEFLFFSIQESFSSLNLYFGLFLALILFIIMLNFYTFFIKFKKFTVLMIFLFLFSEIFFAQLSQIRQFTAISFFILSYYYAYEKKYYKTILNLLLACGFHFSAIFVSVFLFIRIKVNKFLALVLLGLAAILPFVNIQIIFRLPLLSYYSGYLDSKYNVNLSVFHYLKFYVLLIIIIFYILYMDKIKDSNLEQLIMNGIILNMIIYAISFQFAPIIRVSSYFKVFEIVFLVYFFDRLKYTSKALIGSIVTSFILGVFGGIVVTDPYDLNMYEFAHMRIFENRSEQFLRDEMDRFYKELDG